MSSPNTKAATSAKRRANTEQSRRKQKASKMSDSDSDSDVESVATVSPVDISSLLDELGLTSIRSLRSLGERIPILGDGNCGYYAVQRGLEAYGDIERDMDIGEFRLGLYGFAKDNPQLFIGTNPRYFATGVKAFNRNEGLGVMCPDGEAVGSYNVDYNPKRMEYYMKTLKKNRTDLGTRPRARVQRFLGRLRPIWEADVNFSSGCSSPHYFDAAFSPCVLARKYNRSIVLYQIGNNKSTSISHYDAARDCVVLYLVKGLWYTPPPASVCIIHNGSIHYEYIMLEKKWQHHQCCSPSLSAASPSAASPSAASSPSDEMKLPAISEVAKRSLSAKSPSVEMKLPAIEVASASAISLLDDPEVPNEFSAEALLVTSPSDEMKLLDEMKLPALTEVASAASASAHHASATFPISPTPKNMPAFEIFDSPTKNTIAAVAPRESYQYFDIVEFEPTNDGLTKAFVKYLPVTEEISVDITLEEALSLISVDSKDEGTAHTVSWLPPANKGARADFIKRKTKEVRPKHVPIVCKNSNLRNLMPGENNLALIAPLSSSKGEGSGRGKKSDHNYIAYCNGWCRFKPKDCKTKIFVGFDFHALSAIIEKSAKIPLKMKFIGNCRHPKNEGSGQVRGSVRQEIISRIIDPNMSRKTPKTMVEDGLSAMDDAAYHANNFEDQVVSATTASNILREAREALLQKYGLGKCKFENISRARTKIVRADLAARNKSNDGSSDYAGIFRFLSLDGDPDPSADARSSIGIRTTLFHKSSVVILHELCKTGRGVLNYDASGNMMKPIVQLPGGEIILHNILSISPLASLVAFGETSIASRLVQPKVLMEYISNRNAGPDHVANVFDMFIAAELSIFGTVHRPLLISVDCAGAIQQAALESYGKVVSSNQIKTRVKYHNVLFIILLRYEFIIASAGGDLHATAAAKMALERMRKEFPILVHECLCHVYRATKEWASSTKRPAEFSGHDRFETVLVYIVLGACKHWSVSKAIAHYALVTHIFRTEYLPAPVFDVDSPTTDHHTEALASSAARQLDSFLQKETAVHQVSTNDAMDAGIKAAIDVKAYQDKFSGMDSYIDPSVERACSDGIPISEVYLKSVDRDAKKGTLGIVVYYGVENNDERSPIVKMVGGMELEVDLPFNACQVKNPIYSKAADKYMNQTLGSKLCLYSCSLIKCLETALGNEIYKSNAASEGLFRWQKASTELRDHDSELALYMFFRWLELVRTNKLFIKQMDTMEAKLANRKAAASKKSCSKEKSKDALAEDTEFHSDVVWARDNWTTYQAKLKTGLARAFTFNKVSLDNATQQFRALKAHAKSKDLNFSEYGTYSAWWNGKRKSDKKLHKDVIQAMESYISTADEEFKKNDGELEEM